MKVSVLIPTYNRAAFVTQAIDSVLDQDFRDREIVVVDDGSTDDTPRLLAAYGDRIRYVRTENRGVAAARNTGMALARGEYLCYLDSDDLYHPAKLAVQAAFLDANPDVGMVYTEFSAFDDERGTWSEYHLRDYHASAYRRGGLEYDDLFDDGRPLAAAGIPAAAIPAGWETRQAWSGRIFDAYMLATVVFTNSMMFRRDALHAAGPQNPRFGFFHDLEFALRLCRTQRVAFLDVPSYRLRYHPGQISTARGPRAAAIAIRKQQDLLRVLKVHGLHDEDYYRRNAATLDRQFSRLGRAVALPLLAWDDASAHRRRYYPRRARRYLAAAARAGHPQRWLWASSYLPSPLRRVALKIHEVASGLRRPPGREGAP